jgi:hypothetical protein
MVPLYAARIEDLGPGEFVKAECVACATRSCWRRTNCGSRDCRCRPTRSVLDLKYRLRCRECDARGKAVLSIRWAEA